MTALIARSGAERVDWVGTSMGGLWRGAVAGDGTGIGEGHLAVRVAVAVRGHAGAHGAVVRAGDAEGHQHVLLRSIEQVHPRTNDPPSSRRPTVNTKMKLKIATLIRPEHSMKI